MTHCDRQGALRILRIVNEIRVRGTNVDRSLTNVWTMWCIKNFLNRIYRMSHVRELSHCNLGRNHRRKAKSSFNHPNSISILMWKEYDNKPSVTIPSVPSAPMKSFVVSIPAEDFLARRRVLITFPFGNTTVYSPPSVARQCDNLHRAYNIQKPFSTSRPIPDSVSYKIPGKGDVCVSAKVLAYFRNIQCQSCRR